MWKKYVFSFLILMLLCGNIIQAVILSIGTEQETYLPGDNVQIAVWINNPYPEPIEVVLDCQVRGRDVSELDRYVSYSVTLEPYENEQFNLLTIPITDTTLAGTYSALVQVRIGGILEQEQEVTFTITGTLKDLSLLPLLCRDPECGGDSRVFIKGEKVFLGFSTPISDVQVRAVITTPEGSQVRVSLPTEILISQVGVYQLQLEATKSGYRPMTWNLTFAGIYEEPRIVPGAPRVTISPVPVPTPSPTKSSLDCIGVIAIVALLGLLGKQRFRRE